MSTANQQRSAPAPLTKFVPRRTTRRPSNRVSRPGVGHQPSACAPRHGGVSRGWVACTPARQPSPTAQEPKARADHPRRASRAEEARTSRPRGGAAGQAVASFVDLALRQLATAARASGAPLPQLGVAVLDDDGLTLLFTEPAASDPPTPWTETPDHRLWSLRRTVELEDSLSDQPAPYPALVSFAEDSSGRTWLLDLESLGAVIHRRG